MSSAMQQTRLASIETSLGRDAILLKSLTGSEQLSEHFNYVAEVELTEEGQDIGKLLGEAIGVTIELPEAGPRFIGAHVAGIERSDIDMVGRLELRPWFWLLSHATDCLVYREMSIVDIITKVFDRHSDVANHEFKLAASYPVKDMVVQYNESDSDFVSRLMNENGLYYHYSHSSTPGVHSMIITDISTYHEPFSGYDTVVFFPDIKNADREEEVIFSWHQRDRYQSGRCALKDFSYQQSHNDMAANTDWGSTLQQQGATREVYRYPGDFQDLDVAQTASDHLSEAIQTESSVMHGQTNARGMCCGSTFKLSKHLVSTLNDEYLITDTSIQLSNGEYRAGAGGEASFHCNFSVTPVSQQYRHTSSWVKNRIDGIQTAIVAGPDGEEIWTNEFGCVKLKFHWDRSDNSGEASSGWIRVSQIHAGKGFGAYDIPRIGEEVIVQFIEGDPERPIVIGRVYNDFSTVPISLPDNASLSGVKSNSTPGGGGFNELTFDDSKGEERLMVQAEKDMEVLVKNDHTCTIENNETRSIKADQVVTIDGSQDVTVESAATKTFNSTYDINATSAISISSNREISLKVGGSSVTLTPAGIDIKSSGIVTVKGSLVQIN